MVPFTSLPDDYHSKIARNSQCPARRPHRPDSPLFAIGYAALPFHGIRPCARAVLHIYNGGLPSYPGSPAIERGLTTDFWELIRTCWETDPMARPTAVSLVAQLNELR